MAEAYFKGGILMASRPIRRKRFNILDQMGVEEIADIYIEEATGVRQLMALLFEPERGGQAPGAMVFYQWLDTRGLRDEWKKWVGIKTDIENDRALEIALAGVDMVDRNPSSFHETRRKMDEQLWRARRRTNS
jgi:hypothetical protein